MRTKDIKPIKKVHLDNFHIAGFGYWDGCEAFEHLKVGTKLELVREADNAFDPYAVAIYYGEYKLGFVPRGHNHDISKYLDMAWMISTMCASQGFPLKSILKIRSR